MDADVGTGEAATSEEDAVWDVSKEEASDVIMGIIRQHNQETTKIPKSKHNGV